jgi:hypothetical protein
MGATMHCRGNVELNHCMGQAGEFKAIQGLQIAMSTLVTGLAYVWKKSDRTDHLAHSQWWMFPIVAITFNVFASVREFRRH